MSNLFNNRQVLSVQRGFTAGATAPGWFARNRSASTIVMLSGLAFTAFFLESDHAVGVFYRAAIGIGLTLGICTAIESAGGVRNLIRVDILCIWALYGLTFLEFLFPHPEVDTLVSPASALNGTYAVFLGFAGLALGRHLVPRRARKKMATTIDVDSASIFLLFIFATLVGYFHVFLAVNFDPFEVLRQMSLPRFSQTWGRGRYGDAYSLLFELGALIYLIPPIAGLVYARSQKYSFLQKIVVTIVLLFTFYYGFASGTRNILATYVIMFLGAYFLNKPGLKLWQVVGQGVPVIALLFLVMTYMLEFRNAGLGNFSFEAPLPGTVFIDHNMVIIARLTDLFPDVYGYLGFEIPYLGLIHPIPRVFWPGKPEGMSVSIEAALGANASTVTFACTYIGEAYLSGGLLGVLLASLIMGMLAEMWNRVGRNVHSQYSQLLYASGFLCAALTMRSMMWASVTMLPTVALWVYGKLWLPRSTLRRSDAPEI